MHLLVDKKGLPLWITTTSAKGNEKDQALILLNQMIAIQIKDSKDMTICEADKGYDSKAFRQAILNKGYVPIIGYRKHTKEKASKEEIANYFGVIRKRWVVERTFSCLKRKCRRLF